MLFFDIIYLKNVIFKLFTIKMENESVLAMIIQLEGTTFKIFHASIKYIEKQYHLTIHIFFVKFNLISSHVKCI